MEALDHVLRRGYHLALLRYAEEDEDYYLSLIHISFLYRHRAPPQAGAGGVCTGGCAERVRCASGKGGLRYQRLPAAGIPVSYTHLLAGENGVAAYGVIMYAAFLFVAVFVGLSLIHI